MLYWISRLWWIRPMRQPDTIVLSIIHNPAIRHSKKTTPDGQMNC